MIELNPSQIAQSLVIMIMGGWFFWVTKSIAKLLRDMDACFTKLRGKDAKYDP